MIASPRRSLSSSIYAFVLLSIASHAWAFQMPECDSLEEWASGYVPDETVDLSPKVRVTSLLGDEKAAPLFGQPVLAWSARDMASLRKGLATCRKAAHKRKDKAASDRLYRVLKAVDGARAQLSAYQRIKGSIAAGVQRLTQYPPSPRLARQIALSEDVLQGKQADLSAHGLQRMPNWIATFKQAPDYLPRAEIDAYVATLAARRTEMEKDSVKLKEDFTAARQELAATPLTAAGMQTLDRLEGLPWLKQLTPQEQDAFRNDISRKRLQYAQAQRRQQAPQQPRTQAHQTGTTSYPNSQKAAAAPPDMQAQLNGILTGNEVQYVTIKGLAPGVPERQAIRHAQQRWGFRETVTLSFTPAYGLGNTLSEFKSMDDGTVGEINFTVRFKAPLDNAQALQALTERFGKPAKTEAVPAGQRLTWRDGDRILQVLSANRVNQLYRGYKSRLGVALWSNEYEDYLEEVNDHCDELKEIPMNELSLSQKQYLAGHCPLMGNAHKQPGLEAAL